MTAAETREQAYEMAKKGLTIPDIRDRLKLGHRQYQGLRKYIDEGYIDGKIELADYLAEYAQNDPVLLKWVAERRNLFYEDLDFPRPESASEAREMLATLIGKVASGKVSTKLAKTLTDLIDSYIKATDLEELEKMMLALKVEVDAITNKKK